MRWTTAAAAASVLAMGSVAMWWPGDQQSAPLATTAYAQAPAEDPFADPADPKKPTDKPTPKPADKPAPEMTVTPNDNNALAEAKLTTPMEANFEDTPLVEALEALSKACDVDVYCNSKSLLGLEVPADSKVTIALRRVRGDMLLDLMLQQVSKKKLDYVIRDGIVVVTTAEALVSTSEVKAYPIADLLASAKDKSGAKPVPRGPFAPPAAPADMGGDASGSEGPVATNTDPRAMPTEVAQLVNVITTTVAPDSWEQNGGHGSVAYFSDKLIIRQNARTHREVVKVLGILREAAAK